MAPKRTHQKKQNPQSSSSKIIISKTPTNLDSQAAMSDSVFPQDIMLCILTRLPVKSLARFKSVCKPWLTLFTTDPKFIKQHHTTFSQNPQNHSFLIYSLSTYHDHTMSLLKTDSFHTHKKTLQNLHHPFPEVFFQMDFVGSCNGIVCMACPPLGQAIVLWNPALMLFKMIKLSGNEFGVPDKVSLGFGYDDDDVEEEEDFKVVRIVCLRERKRGKIAVGVEVYSTKTETWETIKVDCPFHVTTTKNETIVNGNPCWVAKVDDANESDKSKSDGVVVWFDVRKNEFVMVPVPKLRLEVGTIVHLIEWKGSLAFHVCCKKEDMFVKYNDIWVFDDVGKVWCKKHTSGPIERRVYRLLQCSKSGKFLGESPGCKLFLYEQESNRVEEIEVDDGQPLKFTNFPYVESLFFVKGMEPVVVKKDVEGGDEDKDDDVPQLNDDMKRLLWSYLQAHGGNAGAGTSN